MTLSGDVTLPSQPQRARELWLIDRGNAALTVLNPQTCAVRGQVSVSTGFKSNPHDIAVITDSKAYVTRYETNAAATDDMSRGDDVLVINALTGAVTGRVDLAPEATAVAGATIQARPYRMVIANGKIYVTLGNQDAMFAAAAEGRVVVIDPATDTVSGHIDIAGLKGCSGMQVVGDTLFVACGGSFADPDQAAGSGVAEIDLGASPPVVTHTMMAAKLDGRPVNFQWVAALSATRAFAATLGSFGDSKATPKIPATKDAAFSFDPATGASSPLGLETGAFDLGRAAAGECKLFVPDATFDAPRIHVFDVPATGDPTEASAFDPDPAKGLPPREIAWY
jgi:hypothetical protein